MNDLWWPPSQCLHKVIKTMIFKFRMIESYHCPYCPYMTTRMFNFKRHCRAAHKIVVSKDHDSEIGQERHVTYHCPNCQFMTNRFNDLKRHAKVIHNILIKHPQDQTRQEEHQCGTRFKDASTQYSENDINHSTIPLDAANTADQIIQEKEAQLFEYDRNIYEDKSVENCKKIKPVVINSKGVFTL